MSVDVTEACDKCFEAIDSGDRCYCKTCFQAAVDHVTEIEKGLAEIQLLVDRQAEDPVLWSRDPYGPSVPEGQALQRALRALHYAIEVVTKP